MQRTRQIGQRHLRLNAQAWRSVAIHHQLVHREMPRHFETPLRFHAAHPPATCDCATQRRRQIARACRHLDGKSQNFEATFRQCMCTTARRLDRHQYPNRARDQPQSCAHKWKPPRPISSRRGSPLAQEWLASSTMARRARRMVPRHNCVSLQFHNSEFRDTIHVNLECPNVAEGRRQ